ncbi:MAG: hypothetical protein PVJ39_10700 [Gammaproteobacteria bacterium]|jgi:hypothetical protein
MKNIYLVLIAAVIPFGCPNESFAVEDDLQTNPKKYGFFLSNGILGSTNDDAAGAGLSLGINFQQQHKVRYTVRYSRYFDIFSGFFSDHMGLLNEVSLLYGRKWKSLWLSAGIGHISGGVYDDITDERSHVSTTGLAYSLLWNIYGGWVGYELSGILSSEDSYTAFSVHFSF